MGNITSLKFVKKLNILALSMVLFGPSLATAQDEALEETLVNSSETEDQSLVSDAVDEIIVTGSRLKRDTYSSVSPMQIITAEMSREVGLINPGDILQTSTASSGQQIDLTFSGFVLDNGPGSSTANLRGLGEARTLVLVNGRRLAPGGAEGAPYAPNLNLVPGSLVQQYDILLDGASSIYGSDAIAGVANVILRKDFNGLEIEGYSRLPEHGGGEDTSLSLTWGKNYDRGFVGFGAEYSDNKHVTYAQRPWTSECETNYEIDQYGEFRTTDLYYSNVYGMNASNCVPSALAGRVAVRTRAGSIYYTPGTSNGGWPNFSESNDSFGGVDGDGDGVTDISFDDYTLNGTPYKQNSYMFPDYKTENYMAYGEYTFEGEANITGYFEAMYSTAEYSTISSPPQLFPTVPANNPYNLCNPNNPDGVDCGLAQDALYTNPNYVASFANYYEDLCAGYGIDLSGCTPATFGRLLGPVGPLSTQPIVSVVGDRSTTEVEFEQQRFVAGFKGDLPGINFGTLSDWSFDIYGSYSLSSGNSHRYGIRGDRLNLSLGVFSTTNTPCENNTGAVLDSDVAPGCVAVNMFAPSLYPKGIVGDFATAAERNYLFDSRDFDTEYEQTVISGYMTGNVYELPAGNVALGFGFESRRDKITSMPDNVARDGLFFGYFSDGGAVGSKDTNELFVEVELPLLANKPFAEELTVNLSTRWTDDEIYGANWTESFKMAWRPINSLLVRGTYGTAFRAPNLRELYLANQTGFGTIGDPCYVSSDAIDALTGTYDPAKDKREPEILTNCLANGVDPTLAYAAGTTSFSTELSAGGALDLNPEESESWSFGFAWEQPFSNEFDLAISSTYYEIEVTNTIIEPSGQYIVNDCYGSTTGNSVFCDRIKRDLSDPTDPRIDIIDQGFINRDSETARGIDFNIAFDDVWTIMDRPYNIGLDLVANRQLERSTLFVDAEGNEDFEEYAGEWGFPGWKANMFFRVGYDDWRFTWETRFISSVHQDALSVDEFSDAFTASDTCLGPAYGDVLCRDYGDAKDYVTHNVSLYYSADNWDVGFGVRNLEDKAPPKVDGSEILSVNNAPIGYGYDLNGRVFFMNVSYRFGNAD